LVKILFPRPVRGPGKATAHHATRGGRRHENSASEAFPPTPSISAIRQSVFSSFRRSPSWRRGRAAWRPQASRSPAALARQSGAL